MEILSTHSLSKSYGKTQALKSLSLQVQQGNVFGVLGPNGSGKTTLLGILLDVLKPNQGSFTWFGQNSAKSDYKSRIGALLETPNFLPYLTGYQSLVLASKVKKVPQTRVEHCLRIVGLWDARNMPFKAYSLGMKQRLAIGSALLSDPEVLVLDEPTNGLDPAGISQVRQIIKDLAKEGKTILLASHLLDEVEKVCTHVAVLQKGELITSGSVNEAFSNQEILELSASDMQALEHFVQQLEQADSYERKEDLITVYLKAEGISAESINRQCAENSIWLSRLVKRNKSLEAKFIDITSKNNK